MRIKGKHVSKCIKLLRGFGEAIKKAFSQFRFLLGGGKVIFSYLRYYFYSPIFTINVKRFCRSLGLVICCFGVAVLKGRGVHSAPQPPAVRSPWSQRDSAPPGAAGAVARPGDASLRQFQHSPLPFLSHAQATATSRPRRATGGCSACCTRWWACR